MDNLRFLSIDYIFYQIYTFFVYVGNFLFGSPATLDSDGDGLLDDEERRIGTNPFNKDTDGDGLSDFDEVRLGTDPLRSDTDGDGLFDGGDPYPLDPARESLSLWDRFFGTGQTTVATDLTASTLTSSILMFLTYFFAVLALIFAGMIFFSYLRWKEELAIAKQKYNSAYKPPVTVEPPQYKHPRWSTVLAHAESLNQPEWRLAILEADTMLAELLDKRGYEGLSIGEQLKNADPERFKTLQDAWTAHKVRNQIAHEGSAFNLTERETRRVIALYERVFREFDFI